MSNSPLISYTKISPFKEGPRNHKIDTVTIHCVVGQLSVEALGEIFQTKRASSNYGIGSDGRIAMYVEEKDRSFCSSNAENDNRAITIECASDAYPPYAVNEKVYKSLIKLLVDICKRNDIPKLKWSTSKAERIGHLYGVNMTAHRDWAQKSCPGEWLYAREGVIANEVNSILEKSKAVLKYKGYVNKEGWQATVRDGERIGKPKSGKYIEAFRLYPPEGVSLTVFTLSKGQTWRVKKDITADNDKVTLGTTNQNLRLEAFEVRVDKNTTGKKLKYRAYAHGQGWTAWAKAGTVCGSAGSARYIEAIQFKFE